MISGEAEVSELALKAIGQITAAVARYCCNLLHILLLACMVSSGVNRLTVAV